MATTASRANETNEQKEMRLDRNRTTTAAARADESEDNRKIRLQTQSTIIATSMSRK